jgi:hypothetical protein
VVAIGVTGHRTLTELDKIHAGVDQALLRIELAFPGQPFTLISSLAAGADCLVAQHVLARPGAGLVVPLPLPRADYLEDFRSVESKQEFLKLLEQASKVIELPPAPTREEAYEAAGLYVLNHSTALLTIWDGREAQGRAGTGIIVAHARLRGLPIAWVHAGNRHAGRLGTEPGNVTFEKL